MSQYLDFIPIALFVAVYFATKDIYWATGTLMLAVALQALVYVVLKRQLTGALKLTLWASLILGGMTLILRDETFIQWKTTVINWALCSALLVSQFVGRANLLQKALGHQLTLTDQAWTTLNYGWALGFFLAGVLNLVVAYNFSMEFWVGYKLWGGFGLTFGYTVITVIYLSRKGFLADPQQSEDEAAAASTLVRNEREPGEKNRTDVV